MTMITRSTSRGQLVPLLLAQDAVAASQTDVQLVVPGETTTPLIDGYPMIFPGDVVGVSYKLNAAGTTGAFTIGATINGTENTTTTQTVGITTTGYVRVPRGTIPFVAGDYIGAEITTAAGWDGTTSDLAVIVWVILYMDGI